MRKMTVFVVISLVLVASQPAKAQKAAKLALPRGAVHQAGRPASGAAHEV